MIEKIAKNVSFTYVLKEVGDGNFGSETNGTWDGMIGELLDGVRTNKQNCN